MYVLSYPNFLFLYILFSSLNYPLVDIWLDDDAGWMLAG